MMNWTDLLCTGRIGVKGEAMVGREESPFLLDLDRITFSSFFRRLQDKTQVHPLSEGGRVRSRLTHSVEVASVGRSLGFGVGRKLIEAGRDIPEHITPHDFGYIVQVACLSHDIGNPPFGHAGESAIGQWFKDHGDQVFDGSMTEAEKADLYNFEGNAQGFRILNKLDYFRESGGFRMSYATLGAFTKYPGDASPKGQKYIEGKKAGFCQAEKDLFEQIATRLGLIKRGQDTLWCRHPLAYLMEAADDICYRVADLEDGVTMECVSFEAVEHHLAPLAWSHKHGETIAARREDLLNAAWYQDMSKSEKLGFLRSKAIGNLTKATVDAFMENEGKLLSGELDEELLALTPFSQEADACKVFAGQSIFGTTRKLEIETASFEILGQLLNCFSTALLDFEKNEGDISRTTPQNQRLLKMMDLPVTYGVGRYEHLLQVTDFISGLSDRSAVNLYKVIKGVSL
ncbi:Deoxyguanosinetriphosphate triphosphohydrolase-like protein [Candidatus Terasakiella magnetica]|uniref:Deoxyguanosinetriphosphate triphosphohydrolase-like protein n=1 Tax=Candidatus Terasakiella magnetica TaxID=1867952 RepID=A0A1C3RLZ0_9PROT|nr:dNTP triphosphohydrolase [Candidatus Terasakiella magnetica]SCA58297.1 Deoxyguanosinetriphosphate triphosphohydrolase-like protein [Candidatus Terasakiella magnetica]